MMFASFPTSLHHLHTFSLTYSSLTSNDPSAAPRCLALASGDWNVGTVKRFFASSTLLSFTMRQDFAPLGTEAYFGMRLLNRSYHCHRCLHLAAVEALSANQTSLASLQRLWSSVMRGVIARAYIAIPRGFSWVVPSQEGISPLPRTHMRKEAL